MVSIHDRTTTTILSRPMTSYLRTKFYDELEVFNFDAAIYWLERIEDKEEYARLREILRRVSGR